MMAKRTAICPIQKRNIHLISSALIDSKSRRNSDPSCFDISCLERSDSCSLNAISRDSAMARAFWRFNLSILKNAKNLRGAHISTLSPMSFSVKLVQERCFAGHWGDGISSLEINLSWKMKGQSIIKLLILCKLLSTSNLCNI